MPYKDPERKKQWEREHRTTKTRKVWWGYLYPDSAPEDWEQRISESALEIVYALHDKDVTATGEPKKPHVHVAVRFSHQQDAATAKETLTAFGVLEKSVQWRDSWKAVCRYMTHMDDPDKFQYSPDIVHECGGADWRDAISRTSDTYRTIREMKRFCREAGVTSYAAFSDWCDENNEEWSCAICDKAGGEIHEYINGLRYDRERYGRVPQLIQLEDGRWVQALDQGNGTWHVTADGRYVGEIVDE